MRTRGGRGSKNPRILQTSFMYGPLQMKLCGCLCLVSAVLCVVVTVTTTVIHMNRLQTLRECVYQAATKTCTCFAGIIDPITQDSESAMHKRVNAWIFLHAYTPSTVYRPLLVTLQRVISFVFSP